MLKAEEQMELAVLRKHGTSIRELARMTGRSRNTVRRYLRGGEAAATRKAAPKRAEKLDPFKPYIVERLEAAAPDRIPAAVLFREIKARGYTRRRDAAEAVRARPFWDVVFTDAAPSKTNRIATSNLWKRRAVCRRVHAGSSFSSQIPG